MVYDPGRADQIMPMPLFPRHTTYMEKMHSECRENFSFTRCVDFDSENQCVSSGVAMMSSLSSPFIQLPLLDKHLLSDFVAHTQINSQ